MSSVCSLIFHSRAELEGLWCKPAPSSLLELQPEDGVEKGHRNPAGPGTLGTLGHACCQLLPAQTPQPNPGMEQKKEEQPEEK